MKNRKHERPAEISEYEAREKWLDPYDDDLPLKEYAGRTCEELV